MTQLAFYVPGIPRAKQSFRISSKGNFQRKSTKEWEGTVAQYAMIARQGLDMPQGTIGVSLSFYLKRSKVKTDIDNLCKGVLDGLKGVMFEDDDQVTELHAFKHFFANDNRLGVAVVIMFDGG